MAAKELADFDAAACQHANAVASTVLEKYNDDARVARSVIPKNKKKKDPVFVFESIFSIIISIIGCLHLVSAGH